MTTLDDMRTFATALSPWAHLATGGPDNSPGTGFMAIHPTSALLLRQYGMGGTERWRA